MTVLLARNRQPPPTAAAGGPHADFAAELVSLPSGLLAMVCEAIVTLKVRLGLRACVCAGSTASSTVLFRFPMWSEPAAIRSVQALCVAVRD